LSQYCLVLTLENCASQFLFIDLKKLDLKPNVGLVFLW